LFTLILFAKANISRRKIKSVNFPLIHTEYEGMVESEGKIDGLNIYSTAEEIRNVKTEILPAIINSTSGYVFETLFDSTETFEARFERRNRIGMNKDYQSVHNLRTYIARHIESEQPVDFDSCESMGIQYIDFLKANFYKELNEIVNYIMEMEVSHVMNKEGTKLVLQNQVLEKLVELIESLLKPAFIKATREWYEVLANKHKLRFKE